MNCKRLLLSLSAVFIFLSNAQAQIPSYVPTTGMLGYWGFNGNGNDESTNGNHLTNNGAVLTTDRFGNANAAYSFNGSNQYLTRTSPSFTFGSTSSFSFSIWVRKTSFTGGVAFMHGSTVNGNFIWNFQSSTTHMMFGTNKQGAAWFWAQEPYLLNQWEHYVGVYTNNTMTFYKNGVQVATNTYTHTAVNTATLPLWVGRGVGGNYFNGLVDDIGIWNRALTASEIQTLYQGCGNLVTTQPANQNTGVGSSASFRVAAIGANSTFQWQTDAGSGFQNIANGGQFSGATNDTLIISNATLANNNQLFRCIIVDGGCQDTSNAVTLKVCDVINLQPLDLTVYITNNAQFTTGSTGSSATYQWQSNLGAGFYNLPEALQYSGTQTATLTVSNTTMINNGQLFRCISTVGTCIDTTDIATLTVINNASIDEQSGVTYQVYPNPSTNLITIRAFAASMGQSYAITDLSGKVLLTGNIEQENTLVEIGHLPRGIYLLSVGDKSAKTIKLVKE